MTDPRPVPAPPGAVPPDSRLAIVDFLRARIAEDEEAAREALALSSIYDQESVRWHWIVDHSRGSRWEPTTYDPARVLRESEAKRLLLDQFAASPVLTPYAASPLGILALPYEDHPDFREEWKP